MVTRLPQADFTRSRIFGDSPTTCSMTIMTTILRLLVPACVATERVFTEVAFARRGKTKPARNVADLVRLKKRFSSSTMKAHQFVSRRTQSELCVVQHVARGFQSHQISIGPR